MQPRKLIGIVLAFSTFATAIIFLVLKFHLSDESKEARKYSPLQGFVVPTTDIKYIQVYPEKFEINYPNQQTLHSTKELETALSVLSPKDEILVEIRNGVQHDRVIWLIEKMHSFNLASYRIQRNP
jgi:hypothetical protein